MDIVLFILQGASHLVRRMYRHNRRIYHQRTVGVCSDPKQFPKAGKNWLGIYTEPCATGWRVVEIWPLGSFEQNIYNSK
jgi:hypothetical protein